MGLFINPKHHTGHGPLAQIHPSIDKHTDNVTHGYKHKQNIDYNIQHAGYNNTAVSANGTASY